jgi:arsenate reductase
MAEGWLKSFGGDVEVYSAGISPASRVTPNAVKVMQEVGIDLGDHYPKSIDEFLGRSFDYVITVCDSANEACPAFSGTVKTRLHMGFEDPTFVTGTEQEVMNAFRKTRDEIGEEFRKFYEAQIGILGKEKPR